MKINGKDVSVREGQTVLEVARDADIYIPTLCTLEGLPNFGACRLCLVKIEGMRGFPPACTTPAAENMVVVTEDEELTKLRRNIVELLLSEHPNSCIVCEDRELCAKYRACPMKSGQITGCQLCPNKEFCGLRNVVEQLGITSVDYEFRYKDMNVERGDPFFDRDYNLCILCGRCVRVCEEIRGMGVLAFTKRGHETRVDTAFGKTHLETDCRFCGACVDVCPTGAMSARGTKWHGKLDTQVQTFCGLCNINCGIIAGVKWGRLVSVNPDQESYTMGQLCVLGRFCIPTTVNHTNRLKYPQVRKDGWLIPVEWDEAVGAVVEGFKRYSSDEIGMVLSPDLSNEAVFLMLELAKVLGADKITIDTDSTPFGGGGNAAGVLSLCSTYGFTEEKVLSPEDLTRQIGEGKLKAIYATEHLAGIEKAEHLVIQDLFTSRSTTGASIILPALTFIETGGSMMSFDGTLREMKPGPEPYARARPDWEITRDVLKALGEKAEYATQEDVRSAFEIKLKNLPTPETPDLSDVRWLPAILKESGPRFRHRGTDLTKLVDDLRVLKEARQ
jgi:predicted molibdopterin-dependent oxidoreductase YjgC